MKETKGKTKTKAQKPNASQPSLKGLTDKPMGAVKAKGR